MKESLELSIRKHSFFRGMKPQDLAILHKGATQAEYQAGEVLFNEGEPANRFFLLTRGSVVLEAREPGDGTAVVECIRPGGVIGWSWLFPPFRWHLRAHALEPTEVIVLDGGHLLSMAEERHDFGYELMKRVAQVAIQRLQSTRRQLLAAEVARHLIV